MPHTLYVYVPPPFLFRRSVQITGVRDGRNLQPVAIDIDSGRWQSGPGEIHPLQML